MEFEAKSGRDGAWLVFLVISCIGNSRCVFLKASCTLLIIITLLVNDLLETNLNLLFSFLRYDVTTFLSHRYLETGDPVSFKFTCNTSLNYFIPFLKKIVCNFFLTSLLILICLLIPLHLIYITLNLFIFIPVRRIHLHSIYTG